MSGFRVTMILDGGVGVGTFSVSLSEAFDEFGDGALLTRFQMSIHDFSSGQR
jgi:hypothetical protein